MFHTGRLHYSVAFSASVGRCIGYGEGENVMLCPGVAVECDNPGCRHGGCQGRLPERPRKSAAVGATAVALRPEPPVAARAAARAAPFVRTTVKPAERTLAA